MHLRIAFAAALLTGFSATVLAQQSEGGVPAGPAIPWTKDLKAAIETARANRLLLMCYVVGPTDDRPDSERDQRRSFRDPQVLRLAKFFVPVRLQRSQNREELQRWGVSPNANLDIVFVDPKSGDKIDTLAASEAGNADTFSQKMHQLFVAHRDRLFQQEFGPAIMGADAKPRERDEALRYVSRFSILSADAELAKLLERENLDVKLRSAILDTLADLSKKTGVDKLIELALAGDAPAKAALLKITPHAANDWVVPLLEDRAERAKFLLGYEVVTKACKISGAKPERFWDAPNEKAKSDEVDRVKSEAAKAADRWNRQNAYR